MSVFHALADPTRLGVVERLSVGPASVSELAQASSMALPSFMQHLAVLERAGLVTSHKAGRTRTYQLVLDALQPAATWTATHNNHWAHRLDQLDALLAQPTKQPPKQQPKEPPRPARRTSKEQP